MTAAVVTSVRERLAEWLPEDDRWLAWVVDERDAQGILNIVDAVREARGD